MKRAALICALIMVLVTGCSPSPTPQNLQDADVVANAPGTGWAEITSTGVGGFSDMWMLNLHWGEVEGATGYEVQQRGDELDSWRTINADTTLTSTATSVSTRHVGYETTNLYRVRAVIDARRVSHWSSPFSIVIPKGNVLYEVEGTADTADLTLRTNSGSEQFSVKLPLTSTDGDVGLWLQASNMTPYISAQNRGTSGTVTCRITVRGTVVSENTSSGPYAIATCSP